MNAFRFIRLLPVIALLVVLLLLPSCDLFGQDKDAPRFAPGEYGGDALDGTEHLFNIKPSPDGQRLALIRKRTPGELSDPRNQLWIVDRDGSSPQFVSVNTGTVDWSPEGERLAVTVVQGIDVYAYTIDLETGEAMQWTGREGDVLSKPTVNHPVWFQDGERLLVSVAQKAYQQPYERGIYTINTATDIVEGPLVELMGGGLGSQDAYVVGIKYVRGDDPLSGNYAKYTFATGEWHWITHIESREARADVGTPVPDPTSDRLVQSRETENADQLFLMNSEGENARRITDLGGDNPRWSYGGDFFTFRRDVHEGEGARYIPFRFDLRTMEAEPLFAAQPDSLPDFPPLSEAPSLLNSTTDGTKPIPSND